MNLKKLLNNKIFLFIVTTLIFGTIGVSAATYFASSQVTYDNKTSGLNATNVQGAIDELYETCTSEKIEIGEEEIEVVTKGDGLYKDEYEDRYFYRGANPNNYITFNNEIWRIISIESDGTIKIMREASIGNRAWDSKGGSYGSNNWARPSDLNTYLNGSYLTSTLNVAAQSQIVAKDWSIGAINYNELSMKTQINKENAIKWNGKVALPTVSEYLRSNSDKEYCGTSNLIDVYYSSCQNTTWMFNSNYNWWTLSPYDNYSDDNILHVDSRGDVTINYASLKYAVYPSVYLSSNVQITGGDGSQSNPYLIK